MAEEAARALVERPSPAAGQSAESSPSRNPARTLTTASWRVTSLHPIAPSMRAPCERERRAARLARDEYARARRATSASMRASASPRSDAGRDSRRSHRRGGPTAEPFEDVRPPTDCARQPRASNARASSRRSTMPWRSTSERRAGTRVTRSAQRSRARTRRRRRRSRQRSRRSRSRVHAVRRATIAALRHERVDAHQVAARALRARIVRRQLVQPLGLHAALAPSAHATRSSAPWQLKPAPKDDIHHQPPGARAAQRAPRARRTRTGCDRLPNSRSTPALQRRSSRRGPIARCSSSSTSRPPACMIHAVDRVARGSPRAEHLRRTPRAHAAPASFGTGSVRMLRSIPPRSRSAAHRDASGRVSDAAALPFDARARSACGAVARAPPRRRRRRTGTRSPARRGRCRGRRPRCTPRRTPRARCRAPLEAISASAVRRFGIAAPQPWPTRSSGTASGAGRGSRSRSW